MKLKTVNNHALPEPDVSSYSDIVSFISREVESMQVVQNAVRVEYAENPGVLAMFSGNFSEFYIMSKGRRRNTNPKALTSGMFEEISPTSDNGTATTASFRDKMMAGETWKSPHDCASVILVDRDDPHFFTINSDGSKSPLTHLTYYIPDKRLNYWDQTSNPGWNWGGSGTTRDTDGFFTWYHPDHAPLTFVYRTTLEATGNDITGNLTDYSVTVNWQSNLTNPDVNLNVPQHYYLYGRRSGTTDWTLLASDLDVLTYTYTVPREQTLYEMEYEVRAHVDGYDANEFSYSNIDNVQIPPIQTPVIVESVKPYYRSRFDADKQVNFYKNSFNVRKTDNFQAGTYEMYRGDVLIATVVADADLNCTITYHNQQTDSGWTYDDTQQTTTGNLADGFPITDIFYASTAANDQPDHYDYTITGMSGSLYVPVYKSTTMATPRGYTVEEIANDTGHTLSPAGVDVTMQAPQGTNIDVYESVRNGEKIVNQQLPNDSEYTAFDSDADDSSWYVTRITTRRFSDNVVDTYGSARDQASWPTVTLTGSELYYPDECYEANALAHIDCDLQINGTVPTRDGYTLLGYRVWRKMGDGSEELIPYPGTTARTATATTPTVEEASSAISDLWPAQSSISVTDKSDGVQLDSPQNMSYVVRLLMKNPEGKVSFAQTADTYSTGIYTGLERIGEEQGPAPVYYNLHGVRVSNPAKGQILIERRGAEVRKVVK